MFPAAVLHTRTTGRKLRPWPGLKFPRDCQEFRPNLAARTVSRISRPRANRRDDARLQPSPAAIRIVLFRSLVKGSLPSLQEEDSRAARLSSSPSGSPNGERVYASATQTPDTKTKSGWLRRQRVGRGNKGGKGRKGRKGEKEDGATTALVTEPTAGEYSFVRSRLR